MAEDTPAGGSDDPAAVETVVVHASDVVTAYEARTRSGKQTVLRVTPPFHARMRARIHVCQQGEYDSQGGPRPLHIDPQQLLDGTCPPYPEPDETAADIVADGTTPDPETHRDHHQSAVDQWRERARQSISSTVTAAAEGVEHTVSVAVLG